MRVCQKTKRSFDTPSNKNDYMKYLIRILLFSLCVNFLHAQTIHLDFPELPEKTVRFFYFKGNRIDSLITMLDTQGQAEIKSLSHRGMTQMFIQSAGGIEFIIGEPSLKIVCNSEMISKESITFPGSKENDFLYTVLAQKSQLRNKNGWLQAGKQFYSGDKVLPDILDREIEKVRQETLSIDHMISSSSLYAAGFIQWIDFMNRLFEIRQQPDSEKTKEIIREMETTADLNILFTSGQLWKNVMNFYINIFNRTNSSNDQENYAASINKIINRLDPEMKEKFLSGVIFECESYGWAKAEEIIFQHITSNYPDISFKDENLQRMLRFADSKEGNMAPTLLGADSIPICLKSNMTLLFFYESGCDNCDSELSAIKNNYNLLAEKGIRIISVAADHDPAVYEYYSKDFSWPDKLCDYNGFKGDNFKNYGVIATPTIFIIDANGNIQGRYAKLEETKLIDN